MQKLFNMKDFYFSCGQSHRHELPGGKVWDKDSVIQVKARTAGDAMAYVNRHFGNQWARCYTEATIVSTWFDNGVCAVYFAPPQPLKEDT